jgi:hypothetical protein
MNKSSTDWNAVDWSKTSGVIALETGHTRMWVSTMRRKLGKPKANSIMAMLKAQQEAQRAAREAECTAAKLAGKPLPKSRPQWQRDQKWLEADWSLSDAELGALYGVSRQRAFEMRCKMGAPKSNLCDRKRREKMVRLLEQLRALPFNPALASADALAKRLGVITPMLIEAEHSFGVERHRAGRLNAAQTALNPLWVDWRLSNNDLRAIWQTSMNAIANARHNFKRGPAHWDGRRRRKLSDEDRWNLAVATRAQERVVQRFHEERQAIAEFLKGTP